MIHGIQKVLTFTVQGVLSVLSTQRNGLEQMPTAAQDALLARSAALLLRACNRARVIKPISQDRRNDLRVEFALRNLKARSM